MGWVWARRGQWGKRETYAKLSTINILKQRMSRATSQL